MWWCPDFADRGNIFSSTQTTAWLNQCQNLFIMESPCVVRLRCDLLWTAVPLCCITIKSYLPRTCKKRKLQGRCVIAMSVSTKRKWKRRATGHPTGCHSSGDVIMFILHAGFMYHIEADETHAAASESLHGNGERSIKSQYCVGGQNRFTKSFMGELPLLDQSPSRPPRNPISPSPFACSLPVFFLLLPHGAAPSIVWKRGADSVSDVTTVFKWSFSGRRRKGLILGGVEHIKDLRECLSVCVGVEKESFAN